MSRFNPFHRRACLAAISLAFLAVTGAAAVHAQSYPTKPIRLVAPFPAGSGPDANAREIAAELTKILGQTVIVENRPGASSIIGTDVVAKAVPDGYTLLVGTTTSMSVLPHMYAKLPFNAERDFAPISLLGLLNTGLIAHPGLHSRRCKSSSLKPRRSPTL